MILRSLKIKNFRNIKIEKIKLDKYRTIIYGGTIDEGKDILLSLVIFFECYNSIYNKVVSNNITINKLLNLNINIPYDVNTFLSINNDEESTIVGNFSINDDKYKIEMSLTCAGMLYINDVEVKNNEKINYVHMYNLDTYYVNFNNDINNLRLTYIELENVYKNKIRVYMLEIFDIMNIEDENKNIYIYYKNKNKREIMMLSVDFQKIFASLTLLYYLLSKKSGEKYYLLERPETFLCEYRIRKYMVFLRSICDNNEINLIITSNNKYVMRNMLNLDKNDDKEHILVLEGSNEVNLNGFFTKLKKYIPY